MDEKISIFHIVLQLNVALRNWCKRQTEQLIRKVEFILLLDFSFL